jgi:hypothetical protein
MKENPAYFLGKRRIRRLFANVFRTVLSFVVTTVQIGEIRPGLSITGNCHCLKYGIPDKVR